MENAETRLNLMHDIGNYLFACFQWASSFDDAHGHFNVLSLQAPSSHGLETRLLRYQRETNPVYARYCDVSGVPNEGKSLLDWPPLPVECFKRAQVCPFDPAEAIKTFYSSGTTTDARSTHCFRSIELLQKTIIFTYTSLISRAFPRSARILSLMPSHDDNPNSSLGYMIQYLMDCVGTPNSRSFFSMQTGLDIDGLIGAFRESAQTGEPVHLMGPAFAYVQLLDTLGDATFQCAPGSALLETGGYKGKTREIPKTELRDQLAHKLGIARNRIYGEYGMCELSSQGYELCALNAPADRVPEEGLFLLPPWLKCIIYAPDTMRPVLPDNDGQIAMFDLCNLDSAAFILTGDVGRLVTLPESLRACLPGHPRHALKLYGRAANAVPKGCSMAWDEWHQTIH